MKVLSNLQCNQTSIFTVYLISSSLQYDNKESGPRHISCSPSKTYKLPLLYIRQIWALQAVTPISIPDQIHCQSFHHRCTVTEACRRHPTEPSQVVDLSFPDNKNLHIYVNVKLSISQQLDMLISKSVTSLTTNTCMCHSNQKRQDSKVQCQVVVVIALASINEVNLRRARLVLRWATQTYNKTNNGNNNSNTHIHPAITW